MTSDYLNLFALSNRELALLAWSIFFLLLILFIKNTRQALKELIRAFFHVKVISVVGSLVLYVCVIIALLRSVHYWTPSLLKETLIWTTFSGITLLVRFITATKPEDCSTKVLVWDHLKLIVLFEYIVNAHNFSLLTEIFFIPTMTFLVVMHEVSKTETKFELASRFLASILGAIGIAIFLLSAYKLYQNIGNTNLFNEVRTLTLPLVMSIASVPLLYFWRLISCYENFFIVFDSPNYNDKGTLRNYGKRRALLTCHLNLKKLQSYMSNPPARLKLLAASSRQDIDSVFEGS